MEFFSLIFKLLIACLVVASLAQDASSGQPEAKAEAKQSVVKSSARAKFVMPKLYDFATYSEKYKKNYEYPAELAMRTKQYIARVCTIFMSVLRYKHKLSSKYMKIGPFTDWTDEERGIITSDSPIEVMANGSNGPESTGSLEDVIQHRAADSNLTVMADDHEGDHKPRKLDGDNVPPYKNTDRGHPQDSGGLAVDERQVNPSAGSEAKRPIRQSKRSNSIKSLLRSIKKAFKRSHRGGRLEKSPNRRIRNRIPPAIPLSGWEQCSDDFGDSQFVCRMEENTLYTDYSNRFSPPKEQGLCKASYAFATIALIEYHQYFSFGVVEPLSEQYMIDCGPRTGLRGCSGGTISQAFEFVRTYGVEFGWAYPYKGAEKTCPYYPSFMSELMGRRKFMKTNRRVYDKREELGRDAIKELLNLRGPLIITLIVKDDFPDYAGGVDDLRCDLSKQTIHSMVIVGHGLEDGNEYWLIKNSYGPQFGTRGYYKLNTEGQVDCIQNIAYFSGRLHDNHNYKGEEVLARMRYQADASGPSRSG